jgi:signal transduction histidine kinase
MAPDQHPATTTLMFVSLILMCGIPLASWLTLEKAENPTAAKQWFGGLALNACATFLLILSAGFMQAPLQAIAHAMTGGGTLMIGDALRRSNYLTPVSKPLLFGLPGALAAVTLVFAGSVGVDFEAVRATYLLFMSLLFVWLFFETLRLYQRYRYRSVLLIGSMLSVISVATLLRSFAYFVFGVSPLLPSFSPSATLAWITNLSAVVLCSFGYWSFVLERFHESDLDARQKIAEARARAEQAEADREALSRLIEERDEMILLNSRMTGLSGASVFGAGVIHEVNQYLEALTARLGAADLLSTDQHPTLRVQLSEALELTETVSASIRPLRDLLVAGKPKVEPVEVAAEVAGLVGIIDSECARHGIVLDVTVDPTARYVTCACDRVLLRRIIINLATNAIQELARVGPGARAEKGRIRIDVAVSLASGQEALRIVFSDNGSGFPPDMLLRPLTLLKTYRQDGIGLGLVLSDMVLRSWDGALSLENENGAKVTMFIPLTGAPAAAQCD